MHLDPFCMWVQEEMKKTLCLSVLPHQTTVLRRGPPDSVAVSMISLAWVTNRAALAPLRLLSKKWITSLISSLLSRSILRPRNWWAVTGGSFLHPLMFSLFSFFCLNSIPLTQCAEDQVSEANTSILGYIGHGTNMVFQGTSKNTMVLFLLNLRLCSHCTEFWFDL